MIGEEGLEARWARHRALADAVRRLAGRLGVPQKAVYLAVHMRVLGRLLDERRVVSGVVANGRLETRGGEESAVPVAVLLAVFILAYYLGGR